MSYVAECEQCGVLERGDLEAVGDVAEDHEQFHEVRVERVTTDGGEEERATLNKDEWDPETAELRNGETTDVDSHARRNAEQLRMAETNLEDDDNLVTDGGQDVRSEWTLVCGVQRWQYKDATSARSLAGVGTQNHCRNGTRGCPGPDAGGGELPCSACFLQEGDADA
jgi:hypothetical protein